MKSKILYFFNIIYYTIHIRHNFIIIIPPHIYAEGYIVFVFPFVRLYVRSFVLPSRL